MIDMFVGLVAKIFKQIDAANQIIPLQVSWCRGSTGVSKQGNGIVTNWIIINIRETSKQWEQRSSCIEVDKLITTNRWRKQEARGAMRGWCAGWVEVEKNVRCPTETGEREKCRTSRVYQLLSNKFLPFVELCILFKFHGATCYLRPKIRRFKSSGTNAIGSQFQYKISFACTKLAESRFFSPHINPRLFPDEIYRVLNFRLTARYVVQSFFIKETMLSQTTWNREHPDYVQTKHVILHLISAITNDPLKSSTTLLPPLFVSPFVPLCVGYSRHFVY